MARQEDRERFYLDDFLLTAGLTPTVLKRGDDPPDFVMTLDQREIAIEVTEFFEEAGSGGAPTRAQVEPEWLSLQKAIWDLQQQHPELAGVVGSLSSTAVLVPPRRSHLQIASSLIAFAADRLPELTNHSVEFQLDSEPELYAFFDSVSLRRTGAEMTWSWLHEAAFVGVSAAAIQRTIGAKVRMSRETRFDESWLLVVSGERISQAMGLPTVEQIATLTAGLPLDRFDRIHVFEYMWKRILEWRAATGWGELRPARFAT